jgi:hypothetical protein
VVYRQAVLGESPGVSEDETRRQAAAWAERTAIEQGPPPRVIDIAVLCEILHLLGWSSSSDLSSSERTLAQAAPDGHRAINERDAIKVMIDL